MAENYRSRIPNAIDILEEGLEDSLSHYSFPTLDFRKISSNNLMERLKKEIRRRIRVIGIYPNTDSYDCLISVYLIESTEEWSILKAYLVKNHLNH